jgi:molybdopterin synthase sulfur carrier subunit
VSGATINVLYFARVADLTGKRHESWPLPAPIDAGSWLKELESRYPQLAPSDKLKLAINQCHAKRHETIRAGDEVAVFDPVTGG